MPITRVVGNDGAQPTLTGHALNANQFSLTRTQTLGEVTGFADTDRIRRGGVRDSRGTVTGVLVFDAASTSPAIDALSATAISVVLTFAPSCTWTQNMLVEEMTASSNFRDNSNEVTANVVGAAVPALAWDQT